MLFTFAMRYGVLLLGLGFGAIAVSSWQAGAPPAWSFAAPRAETVVRASAIEVERIGNGTLRHHAIVQVAWPPGQPSTLTLASLRPGFSSYAPDEARALVATHPPGRVLTVRVVNGLPHADRHDRFQLLHAAFMSVMSLVVTALGALFFVVFREESSSSSGPSSAKPSATPFATLGARPDATREDSAP